MSYHNYLNYIIPFVSALLFIVIKYIFFTEEETFDTLLQLFILFIINFISLYLFIEYFPKKIENLKPKTSRVDSIYTGPPNFFPYQKV